MLTLLLTGVAGLAAIYLINRHLRTFTGGRLHISITEIPAEDPKRIAIVFGARVWDDGSPSNSLYDRVITGVELYKAGRVQKLLMSGDKTGANYDEPAAMRKLALQMGIPESDIYLDNDGKKTYDTCYRANAIFGVKRAILVTQDYHQPRALYLCNNLGIESVGISANRRVYDSEWYYHLREFFSRANAWFEINFLSPKPIGYAKTSISQ